MSEIAVAAPTKAQRLPALFWMSLKAHWIFFIIPVCYVLTDMILLAHVPSYRPASVTGLVLGMLALTVPAGLVAVFLFRLGQYALVIKPESPIRQLRDDVMGLVRNPSALLMGLPLFIAMVVFNKGMLELKPLIPLVNPFSWDQYFMEIDRSLHFGIDPWRILQPVFGHDSVTFAINIFYNFWFLALFGCFMWFGFARASSVNRTQFFLAYMLSWWIGGGLMAVYFSSAGPVYYTGIGLAPDPFTELMAYLHNVNSRIPIWALETQQILWDGYTGKSPAIGISAFPSMHNASALLFALACWPRSRGLGIAFAVYAALILLGSVHLGWHYAVDAYPAVALAVVSWMAMGRVSRWWEGGAAAQAYRRLVAAPAGAPKPAALAPIR